MAINNLSSLQLAIADWVARSDLTSTTIDNFIDIAETEIMHGLYDETGRVIVPGLRCKRMQIHNATYTLTGEYSNLPNDFLGFRSVKLVGNPDTPLEYITPSAFDSSYLSTDNSSTPKVYTVVGDQVRVGPSGGVGTVLDIVYWEKVPSLTVNTTNWLCTNYPNLYLYGALRHLAIYIGMDSRLVFFQSAFITTMAAVHSSEKSTEFSGTSLGSRAIGVTVR